MNRRNALNLLAGAALFSTLSPAQAAAGFTNYDAAKFAKLLQSGATIVVHVHADWCPTCTRQQATLDQMANDPAYGKVSFVRVNFDTEAEFLKANRIVSQSTIIVVKAGREASRFVGITRSGEIRTRIDAAI